MYAKILCNGLKQPALTNPYDINEACFVSFGIEVLAAKTTICSQNDCLNYCFD